MGYEYILISFVAGLIIGLVIRADHEKLKYADRLANNYISLSKRFNISLKRELKKQDNKRKRKK